MQTNSFADIPAATLKSQAAKAHDAGFVQLSHNFLRAAELTAVPDNELLAIYELLRPGRSTHAELCTTADKLELSTIETLIAAHTLCAFSSVSKMQAPDPILYFPFEHLITGISY